MALDANINAETKSQCPEEKRALECCDGHVILCDGALGDGTQSSIAILSFSVVLFPLDNNVFHTSALSLLVSEVSPS